MIRIYLTTVLLATCSLSLGDELEQKTSAVNDAILKVERELEEWRHDLLKKIKTDAGVTIRPFSTDGCSGGMSDGWYYMARALPPFREKFGDKPPWEACCVTHDEAYWAGETEHGFEKRLQADQVLRQCVSDYGKAHSVEFSQQFSLDKTTIEKQFAITAELMFRAVRAGGQPCTYFPWRWGYGWPLCQNNINNNDANKGEH